MDILDAILASTELKRLLIAITPVLGVLIGIALVLAAPTAMEDE